MIELTDFISGYKNANDKVAYIKKNMTRTYVNYTNKVDDCDKIVRLSSYDSGKQYKPSTTTQYFIFITTLIHRYLDIETDDELYIFDAFEQNGITESFVQALGGEYNKYSTILNMVARDTDAFENSVVRFLNNQIEVMKIFYQESQKAASDVVDSLKNGKEDKEDESINSRQDVQNDNEESSRERTGSSDSSSTKNEG